MARLHVLYCVLLLLLCVGLCKGELEWCVVDPLKASDTDIQTSLDYICSRQFIDCSAINPEGACFEPNTYVQHGSYALNLYYVNNGDCPEYMAKEVVEDPSYPGCQYTPRLWEFAHKPKPSKILE